jgi:phage terminase small subunit
MADASPLPRSIQEIPDPELRWQAGQTWQGATDLLDYIANQYAETVAEKELKAHEAHKWLKENGIDRDKDDTGELTDYELPSLETWSRQVRKARRALGEQKYNPRAGRAAGRSIVAGKKIEYQRGSGE